MTRVEIRQVCWCLDNHFYHLQLLVANRLCVSYYRQLICIVFISKVESLVIVSEELDSSLKQAIRIPLRPWFLLRQSFNPLFILIRDRYVPTPMSQRVSIWLLKFYQLFLIADHFQALFLHLNLNYLLLYRVWSLQYYYLLCLPCHQSIRWEIYRLQTHHFLDFKAQSDLLDL